MNDTCKLPKLVDRLQHLSDRLERIKDLTVHQCIDHFYYMQKKAELLALSEQLEETKQRLSNLTKVIEKEYNSTFSQWHYDVRWLQHYFMKH